LRDFDTDRLPRPNGRVGALADRTPQRGVPTIVSKTYKRFH